MHKHLSNRRGFTLIEIMVVIVILAALAALVGPKIIGRSDDAKLADAKLQIRNFETALKLYKLDNGVYPATEQGLMALVSKPTVGQIPRNYRQEGYLEAKRSPRIPGVAILSTFHRANRAITTFAPLGPTASRVVRATGPTSATGTSSNLPGMFLRHRLA